MIPGTIDSRQTARLLVRHGLLSRRTDGLYDAGIVAVRKRNTRFLNLLGVPLCDRELHALNPNLRIPSGGTGGLLIGGARYMRLWEVLDGLWD